MGPEPTKVKPEDLATLAGGLRAAGTALADSLGTPGDLAAWTDAGQAKDCFGPAKQTADVYAALSGDLPGVVTAAKDRLHHGSDVFREASSGFADRDTRHGNRLRQGSPR